MKNKSAVSLLGVPIAFGFAIWAVLGLRPVQSVVPSHYRQKAESSAPLGSTPAMPISATLSQSPTLFEATPAATNEVLRELHRQMSDPLYRQAAQNRAQMQVAQKKGRLFLRLRNVSMEKLDELKTILAETDVLLQKRMLPDPDNPNSNPAVVQQQTQTECDGRVRLLLGAEDFAKYASYQQSEPYRDMMGNVNSNLQSQGILLSDDQQEDLIDAYAQAICSATQDAIEDNISAPAPPLDEYQKRTLRTQQLGRFDQYLAANVSRILDADHFKLFMAAQYVQESGNP